MQVAEVLSDLTSLYVCDHSAAMSLVSSYKQDQQPAAAPDTQKRLTTSKKHSGLDTEGDVDLQRALDLSNLHSEMKEKHGKGAEMDKALDEARRKVTTFFSQVSQQK